MKSFWPTWKLSAFTALLAVSASATEPPLTFAPPFRSGMVLADWRGGEETNIILQGSQPEDQTVFVRFGTNKAIKAESTGTEWRLSVKEWNKSKLVELPSGPFNVEVETKAGGFFTRLKTTGTNRLTNVLVGDVWVVEVEPGRNAVPEVKSPGASVRFFLGDPAAKKGSSWFPSGPGEVLPPIPAIAAYFAEALSAQPMKPVGIYVTARLPLEVKRETKNLNTWDERGEMNYTRARVAASAARKKALQKLGEERAIFIDKSRAAKSQGRILEETLPPAYDDKVFSYGHRGASSNSLPVFGQLHVHGFLW